MSREILEWAIRSVFNCEQAFCKFLSANDAGATGAHQAGILISLKASTMLFRENLQNENILILSILVDTFISKISFPMQPGPEIGSISDA